MRRYITTSKLKKLALAVSDMAIGTVVLFAARARRPANPEPRKILVVALGHLGDALLFSYMLPALHRRYPGVLIDVLAGGYCAPILKDNVYIHRLIPFDHVRLNRLPGSFLEKVKAHIRTLHMSVRAIRAAQYDVSIDPKLHYPNGNLITYLGRIPTRIGFGSGGFGPLLTQELTLPAHNAFNYAFVMEMCLRASGVELTSPLVPYFFVGAATQCAAEKFSLQPRNYVLMLPESANSGRMLAWSFWEAVIAFVLQNTPWQVIVAGVRQDTSDWVDALQNRAAGQQSRVLNTVGKLKLTDIFALSRAAAASVTVESLPAHLCAIDGDTISVFKNGSGALFFPIGTRRVTVLHDHAASRALTHLPPKSNFKYFPVIESKEVLQEVERTIIEIFNAGIVATAE